jgi:hypothetical protein
MAACAPAPPPRPTPPRRGTPPPLPLVRAEDPEDAHTWTRRLARDRGAHRSAHLRRTEALHNLRRLHQRIQRETREGSAARKARLTRFRELVIPPLLARLRKGASTPIGARTLVEALLAFAPDDGRVIALLLSLFERRAPPPGYGTVAEYHRLVGSFLKPLARRARAEQRRRLLRALEALVTRRCQGNAKVPAQGMTHDLKRAAREILPILNRPAIRARLKSLQSRIDHCP